ncbi:MAG: hypothetical protein ABSC76_05650 [Terracidiphilus sp.]|jgi:hypothetical protein
MNAKSLFRIFTFAPRFYRAAAQNSEQPAQPLHEPLPAPPHLCSEAATQNNLAAVAMHVQVSITEEVEARGQDLDDMDLSSPQRICRDCGSPLDPFGDCPRMDARGREMESAPRYCEPNVIHLTRQNKRGQATVGRRGVRL